MGVYIDPITGEVSYTNNGSNGSPTNGGNKGQNGTSTSRDSQQTPQDTATKKVKDQIIEYCEGVIGLLPNPNFKAKVVYNVRGVGSVFNGNYYVKKMRHTIGGDTYTVEADVVKLEKAVFTGHTYESTNRPQVDPAPQPVPTAPSQPSYTMYRIVRGDTLWGIARRFYGNGALYPKIFEANRDTVKNPNLIYAGNWLRIPK